MKNTKFFIPLTFLLLFGLFANKGFAQGLNFGMKVQQFRPLGDISTHMPFTQGLAYDMGFKLNHRFRLGVNVGFAFPNYVKFDSHPLQGLGAAPGNHSIESFSTTFFYFVAPRFYILNKGRVKPYINAKLGQISFTTHVNMEYNTLLYDDKVGVECPDRSIRLNDAPFVAGLGAGLEVAVVKDVLSLVIETNYLSGGDVRHLSISPPANTTLQNLRTSGGDTPASQEHSTATIARSRLQMLDIHFGFFVSI
jgi:hypothetical protein